MNGMPEAGDGRCLCGAVRYAWSAAPLWAGHCHCESCRRNCSAPMTSFFGIANGAWQWTSDAPAIYESSSGNTRSFCNRCGTPMAYASQRFPDEIHFYAASMTDPEAYRPTVHFHADERLSWLHLADDLPQEQG